MSDPRANARMRGTVGEPVGHPPSDRRSGADGRFVADAGVGAPGRSELRHTLPSHPADGARRTGRGVLEGAFLILEELARVREAGLTEIAAHTGLPKATAHRLLSQLLVLGAVEHRAGRYGMGTTVVRLGRSSALHRLLARVAAQPLRRLAAVTRASVAVIAPSLGDMVIVAGLPAASHDKAAHAPGTVLPPGSAAEAVIAAARPLSPPPPGHSPARWAEQLSQARAHGVAVHRHMSEAAMTCVAAPVHAPSGRVVAAVGASLVHDAQVTAAAEAIRHSARAISTSLAAFLLPGSSGCQGRSV